ncbi:unnamed protein product, partial [Ectocarpus fasciculatus]
TEVDTSLDASEEPAADPLPVGVHVMLSIGASAETMSETPLPHGVGNQPEEELEARTNAGNGRYRWFVGGVVVSLSLAAALALSGSLGEAPPIAATKLEGFQRKQEWTGGETTGGGYHRRRRRRRSLSLEGEPSGQGIPG